MELRGHLRDTPLEFVEEADGEIITRQAVFCLLFSRMCLVGYVTLVLGYLTWLSLPYPGRYTRGPRDRTWLRWSYPRGTPEYIPLLNHPLACFCHLPIVRDGRVQLFLGLHEPTLIEKPVTL